MNRYPFVKLHPEVELYHYGEALPTRFEVVLRDDIYLVTREEFDRLLQLDGDCSPKAVGMRPGEVELWRSRGVLVDGSRLRRHGFVFTVSLMPLDFLRDSTVARRITLLLFLIGPVAVLSCAVLFGYFVFYRQLFLWLSISSFDLLAGVLLCFPGILLHEAAHALSVVSVNPKGRCHELAFTLPVPAFYVSIMVPERSPFMKYVIASSGIHATALYTLFFSLLALPDTPLRSSMAIAAFGSSILLWSNLLPHSIHDGCKMLESVLNSELASPLQERTLSFLCDSNARKEVLMSKHAFKLIIAYVLCRVSHLAEMSVIFYSLFLRIHNSL